MPYDAHKLTSSASRTPPVLMPMTGFSRLLVPIPASTGPALRIGSVRRGDRLLDGTPGAPFDPRAPIDATVTKSVPAKLVGGITTLAAELIAEPAADAAPPPTHEHPPPGSEAPSDLSGLIDTLRQSALDVRRIGSPDLLAQLRAARTHPVDFVVCSLLDPDPTLPLQATFAAAEPDLLAAGLNLLARLTGAPRILLATDRALSDTYRRPLAPLARSAAVRLVALPNDYPQSDPTLLLYTLLDRRLLPGHLPVDQGVLLLDAAAAIAVARAAQFGPSNGAMLEIPVAVRDHSTDESMFLTVPVGATVGALINRMGLFFGSNAVVRGGDLLRDCPADADAIFAGGELKLHVVPSQPLINPGPCIRCGWCFEACPTRVQPAVILEAAQTNNPDLAQRAGIEACIECGICSFVCPAQLPLLAGIRHLRARRPESSPASTCDH